ncbi:hypothetical protein WKR88_15070 [Trinickia caryophylli]|uniref:Uncharacterized protein n=1 Tax=Trinickia caryophylli TaxID=28094 RepID=A0A1X7D6Y6_TRICW|nr:hypothetical protein [Trinickia caryophylli]PMS12664.1 hypothetical protein C0Z17_07460 [Trinickia caryophylli]TRX15070.1 hypothetical protein FNF07_28140 [Trinickia caryophylli]WQE14929.1 hypothetical protein U0034_20465 [Trinickia caryophylli]SMF10011.1 hypothetical protein SAMN06295900_102470 [Trinickia caryophylli]GLU31343.1 hypothetical protein Busp01_11850 [Trinickia caryophylli]
MKYVLAHVIRREERYSALALFDRLREASQPPEVRLRFTYAFSFLVTTFGDLDRQLLRTVPGIDRHPNGPAARWPRPGEPYEHAVCGPDTRPAGPGPMPWSEEAYANRALMAELGALISAAGSIERIAIVEAIEATGKVLASLSSDISESIAPYAEREPRARATRTGSLATRSGHRRAGERSVLAAIGLREAQRQYCIEIVDRVFDALARWTHETARHIECALPPPVSAHPAARALS